MIVLIDNGHGCDTGGKRSPDGSHREFRWTRTMADLLVAALVQRGITARRIVTEENDVPLSTRARRVNIVCKEFGAENVILLSLHNDAQPLPAGQWGSARGLTSFVYTKAGKSSRKLAALVTEAANDFSLLGNRSVPSCLYKEANLAILRETACPAVLVECLFMTNHEDVAFLNSRLGLERICDALCQAVEKYVHNS